MKTLYAEILTPEKFNNIYKKVAKAIKNHCGALPEDIRLKKVELNRAQTRVHNFIETVAEGRTTKGLIDALEKAESQAETLASDLQDLERAKDALFEPPPKEWIAHKIEKVKSVLEERTEKSALLLRKYLGSIELKAIKPDIGKSYYQASSRVSTVPLIDSKVKSSNSLRWWTQPGSNRRPPACKAGALPAELWALKVLRGCQYNQIIE